jgi:hypothetical protein
MKNENCNPTVPLKPLLTSNLTDAQKQQRQLQIEQQQQTQTTPLFRHQFIGTQIQPQPLFQQRTQLQFGSEPQNYSIPFVSPTIGFITGSLTTLQSFSQSLQGYLNPLGGDVSIPGLNQIPQLGNISSLPALVVTGVVAALAAIPELIGAFSGRPKMEATVDIAKHANSWNPVTNLLGKGAYALYKAGIPISSPNGNHIFGYWFKQAVEEYIKLKNDIGDNKVTRQDARVALGNVLYELGNPGHGKGAINALDKLAIANGYSNTGTTTVTQPQPKPIHKSTYQSSNVIIPQSSHSSTASIPRQNVGSGGQVIIPRRITNA